MANGTCSVDGCEKATKTRGWCSAHYERWRRNGDPGAAGDGRKRPPKGLCAVVGCEAQAVTRGWCSTHYSRWKVHGDPEAKTRSYGVYRRVTHNGYVGVYEPSHPLAGSNGYVSEHRKVQFDAGVDIADLHVHHRNEDKTDNRPENLEVLSASRHHEDHHKTGSTVKNQYGTYVVKPIEERASTPKPKFARACMTCGVTIPEAKRRDALYCSKVCSRR